MAVQQPGARVVHTEANGGHADGADGDGVSADRVRLRSVEGRVDRRVVAGHVHRLVDDLELVPVQLDDQNIRTDRDDARGTDGLPRPS